jgi:hypothetical protein
MLNHGESTAVILVPTVADNSTSKLSAVFGTMNPQPVSILRKIPPVAEILLDEEYPQLFGKAKQIERREES